MFYVFFLFLMLVIVFSQCVYLNDIFNQLIFISNGSFQCFSFYLSDFSDSNGFDFNDTIVYPSNREYINLHFFPVHY